MNDTSGSENRIIHRIRNRVRYGLLVQELLDRIARLGIRIEPYFLHREGLLNGPGPFLEEGYKEYRVGFLTDEEARSVSVLAERKNKDEIVLEWLRDGQKCYGVKYKGEVISYVWCNFKECRCSMKSFPLKKNEAYLFNGYTFKAHRGKNIAPYMRYQLYKVLAGTGRTHLYSITTYFNTSSRRFKEKVNARPVELFLYVSLFKKWHHNFHVRKYADI